MSVLIIGLVSRCNNGKSTVEVSIPITNPIFFSFVNQNKFSLCKRFLPPVVVVMVAVLSQNCLMEQRSDHPSSTNAIKAMIAICK